MLRAIIADDHSVFRLGLSRLLKQTGDIVVEGECGNGSDALELIRTLKPDIAVLDKTMPNLDGIEVGRAVQKERIGTKLILLTMHKDPSLAVEAVRAGFSGYILKDGASEELIQAIMRIVSGGLFVSPTFADEVSAMKGEKRPVFTTIRAVKWGQELATGIAEIDEQHKEMFNRNDRLFNAMLKGSGREQVAGMIVFLEDYVISHFSTEERYMLQHQYPDYEIHKNQHREFKEKLIQFKRDYQENGASMSLTLQLQKGIVDWLVNHISRSDKDLGVYLRASWNEQV